MKLNFWKCEECEPKSEWLFKDVEGKIRGLTNTGKIFNAVLRNAPASLAW